MFSWVGIVASNDKLLISIVMTSALWKKISFYSLWNQQNTQKTINRKIK